MISARSAAPVAHESKPKTTVFEPRGRRHVRTHTAAAARRIPGPHHGLAGRSPAERTPVPGSARSASTIGAGAATGEGGSSRTETAVIDGARTGFDERSRDCRNRDCLHGRLRHSRTELARPRVRSARLRRRRCRSRESASCSSTECSIEVTISPAVELPERVLDQLGNEQLRHVVPFAEAPRCPAGYDVGNATNACRASVSRLDAITPWAEIVKRLLPITSERSICGVWPFTVSCTARPTSLIPELVTL